MKKYQEFGSFQHRLLERVFVGIIHEWLSKHNFKLPQDLPANQIHHYDQYQYISVPIPFTIIEKFKNTKGLSSEVIQSLTNFFRDNRNLVLWEVEGKRITLKRNNQLKFQKIPRRLRRMRVDIVLYNQEEKQFVLIDWKFTRQGLHQIYNVKMEKYLVWYNYHQLGGEKGYFGQHQEDKWPFGSGIVFYLNQNQQIGIYHQKAESINIMATSIGINFKTKKKAPKSNRICINTQSKGLLELEFDDEDWDWGGPSSAKKNIFKGKKDVEEKKREVEDEEDCILVGVKRKGVEEMPTPVKRVQDSRSVKGKYEEDYYFRKLLEE